MTTTLHLKLLRSLAICVGVASLLLFMVFLLNGALNFIEMGLNNHAVLVWDGFISMTFFVQHSVMIRRRFCSWFATVLPPLYHGVVFTIVSGIVLAGIMVTWQPSTIVLYEFHGVSSLLFRAVSFLSLAGCLWSVYTLRSVRSCDVFGLAASSGHLRDTQAEPPELVVRGPYAYVRHPVYLTVILLIWSCPDVTTDRLLFNVLGTLWIYVGATLEDKDMMADFGEAYRVYRKSVPMLAPSLASFLKVAGFRRNL